MKKVVFTAYEEYHMNNTLDEWVSVIVHVGLRSPKAATLRFYPTEASATNGPLGVSWFTEGNHHAILRFDELPDWVQHKAAAAAMLDIGGGGAKHVDMLGGKTSSSVWVEYEPNDEGRAFERMIKERGHARGNRPDEDLRGVSQGSDSRG